PSGSRRRNRGLLRSPGHSFSNQGGPMPIPIPEAVDESAALAVDKAQAVKSLPGYAAASLPAGVYVGVAVVLLASVAGPLAAAKLGVLFWGLLAFIGSGFEHSIANMTVFSLAVFDESAHWSDLARNLLYTIPGNVIGGAVLVAVPYALIARKPKEATAPEPQL